ncbi:hypothetical protein AMJ39_08435 [candidate division TA06 bacterium DG_24]|uniref:ABC transporter domain-containing protein n=3 Tax=Bacteria division TA06 TaxID=1156500 RepID=A0A0S8JI30_UNCT6|nr:MAG: hypothetical protein AMJ39_08435 [candidate division TA06 bacterium DG_24]KPK68195.1 MAG: hypothetical protein AMJ82_08840 [candidate division TA06 bacterium SM23_40]KPL09462.1 MAG: hypothetical protein AMJ71_06370 [candidate division TA06 bacterium SM1_40]
MILTLAGLTKMFSSLRGDILAVDDVSLVIHDRELFVLLGPSGCGKSTILNLIAGLERPTTGEIRFDDVIVASGRRKVFLSPKERNVAMVFQSYALYPHLSVFENIAFPLRIGKQGATGVEETVGEVAAMLEISDLLRARPAELSGGQRQRVAIARAIVRHPKVFLLDEPLSNLDARLRLAMRGELKNLQRRLGITTVYVTHDQVEAMSLADRIAVVRQGRIEQVGTPDELYNKPANPFVATFIGSPAINLLETAFAEENGVFFVVVGDQKLRMPDEKSEELRRLSRNVCLLGIRPEHIHLDRLDRRLSGQRLKGRVRAVEPLGRETILHLEIDDSRLTAMTSGGELKQGDTIEVDLDLKRAHIFEVPAQGPRARQ